MHPQELAGIGQEVLPGKKILQHLVEGLGAIVRRLQQKLRDVWSLNVAVPWDDLAPEQVLRRDRVRNVVVGATPNK